MSLALQWSNLADLSDLDTDQQCQETIGNVFDIVFTCVTGAVDVTTWSFAALIAPDVDSGPYKSWVDASFNTKTSGGSFTLSVISADTSTLPGRSYYIEVRRVDGVHNDTVAKGFITLSPSPSFTPLPPPTGTVAWSRITDTPTTLAGYGITDVVPGSGTVTSVSVATANGFSGTVATPTTTPVITIIPGSGITLPSPTLTGVPVAPTASLGTNTTQVATCAFVLANASTSGGVWGSITGTLSDQTDLNSALAAKQTSDATLTALAGQNWSLNSVPVGSGADTVSQLNLTTNTFLARASAGNVAAKTVTDFALTFLDDADAPSVRTTIGAGTSSFDGAFSSLSGKPTTLSGYGITDAQPLDAALTALAGGSDFVAFSGPSSTIKTFTLPDSSQTLLYSGGPLGTPASGVVTNLTGTASININGTVGATTPAAGTFTALTGTSGSLTGLTALAIRDTSAAFDVTLAATSSTTISAGRTLTFDIVNAARTIKLTGNPTLADWFDQSVKAGASPTFVTVTAALSGNATTASAVAVGGITGLGTGVATALAVNVGSAGAFVTFNGALGTPSSGTLTNCTFPTLNQNTSGSAASLSISGQTGLLTVTGLASTNRIKTVRDAADTILELGGSYTPTGTWTSLTMVTPVLGTPTSGTLTNCTFPVAATASGLTMATARLLGRTTASSGAIEEITVGSGLSLSGGSLTATGGGTVTATGGSLTANAVVLGAGTTDTKVSTTIITDGTSRVAFGHTAFLDFGGNSDRFNVVGTTVATGGMALAMFNATAGTAAHFDFYRSKNASAGSATVVASGDSLGAINWYGAQQTGTFATQTMAAQIRCEVDGTVTSGASGDMPGRIVFATTADAGASVTDWIILDNSGALIPALNNLTSVGKAGTAFSGLYLASAGVLDWNNGTARITNSGSNLVLTAGAIRPASDNGTALGAGATGFASLFLATDTTINFANGNWVATHSTGIVTVSPIVHIAGTNTIAPLKFTSGTNLSTAAAGAVEYDGTVFYTTPVASARGLSPSTMFSIVPAGDFNLLTTSGVQSCFPTTGDVWTLAASTAYFFEGVYFITKTTTTVTVAMAFAAGGSLSITSIQYVAEAFNAAADTTTATSSMTLVDQIASTVINATSTAATAIKFRGIIRINVGGTLTPQISFSANTTVPVMKVNSYIAFTPLGTNTTNILGNVG